MLTIAGTVITISLGALPFILKQPVDARGCGKLRRMSNQIPMPVHVTAGPTPWDYVVGGCTIAATVDAALAIYLALRAGRDLVEDRRHAFELGVLLDILRNHQPGHPRQSRKHRDIPARRGRPTRPARRAEQC